MFYYSRKLPEEKKKEVSAVSVCSTLFDGYLCKVRLTTSRTFFKRLRMCVTYTVIAGIIASNNVYRE